LNILVKVMEGWNRRRRLVAFILHVACRDSSKVKNYDRTSQTTKQNSYIISLRLRLEVKLNELSIFQLKMLPASGLTIENSSALKPNLLELESPQIFRNPNRDKFGWISVMFHNFPTFSVWFVRSNLESLPRVFQRWSTL
jgi:hypothetical protein